MINLFVHTDGSQRYKVYINPRNHHQRQNHIIIIPVGRDFEIHILIIKVIDQLKKNVLVKTVEFQTDNQDLIR